MKNKLLLATVFFSSFITSIIIATFISYQFQKIEQNKFLSELLTNSEKVTTQLVRVLSVANRLQNFECDQRNINELRKLVQESSEIYDIGYIVDKTVYCTANWGVVFPTKLISTDIGKNNNYQFYANEHSLYNIVEDYNITASGNFFAVNITTPYSRQIKTMPKFAFEIYSSSIDYIFERYTPYSTNNILYGLNLEAELCSERYEYCVKAENRNAGLNYYSTNAIVLIIVFIIIFCYLITHLVSSLIDNAQSIESRFRRALKKEILHMEYQPIIDIESSKIISVECLVRWSDEKYGKVAPPLFISIAEKLSLYPQLTSFTTTRSITDMASILKNDRDFSLSINIRSYEILDKMFLVFLHNLTRKLDVKPSQIKIEITEEIDVGLKELSDFSTRARALGFIVVLDDFGTGVANLVWLTEINFDCIKIDRVFVKALNYDLKKSMSEAIMDLVTSLGKRIVFEGVETEKEYKIIKEQCSTGFIQGWYFYKAMPIDDLISLLEGRR